ncbi:MAG: hypothetical protein ITG02_13075 [Patulibacter sp.]|nr:hypothetical protein [Patulibacter sp.]
MLRRLRKGEWIVVGALVALVVTLFLEWFNAEVELDEMAPESGGALGSELLVAVETAAGWGALGRPWADFLVVAVIAVVVMLVMTLRARPGRPTYGAVVSLILAGAITALVTLLTAIRVLIARPGTIEEASENVRIAVSTSPGPGAWIGLAALIVLLIGLWVAVADDRTDAPDSAFDPPAPRPVPDVVALPGPDAPPPTPEP